MEIVYIFSLITLFLFGMFIGYVFANIYYESKMADISKDYRYVNLKKTEQAYRARLKMLESEKEAILTYLGENKIC